ncbi:ABC transporter permease [Candidatus Saccharibacteria bacterium]|nr:ABC transporter permease [Candidatus Saccharibacteria bacterium]MCB9834772.1 ABC transporter permease [Candidatus Nomurabacteria bacterium]
MITLYRILRQGIKNFFRNAWLSVAATAVMLVTILVVSFFIFAQALLNQQTIQFRQKADVSIYLLDSAPREMVKQLEQELEALDEVESVDYISKDQAYQEFKSSGDQATASLLEESEVGNPFPASLEIKASEAGEIEAVSGVISKEQYQNIIERQEKFSERLSATNRLLNFVKNLGRTGTVISIIFLIISLLIIFNTVRMAIFSRRGEVEIMRLVGATNWFIRGPFLVEGALYGLIGAVVAMVVAYFVFNAIEPGLVNSLEGGSDFIQESVDKNQLYIVLAQLLLGVVIGVGSSWLAVARYLKLVS